MPTVGRATYVKGDRDTDLPKDLTIIDTSDDAVRGETYITVEGPKLPPWVRGAFPWSFRSQSEMLKYREGNHG
jgi:hypothetical protein